MYDPSITQEFLSTLSPSIIVNAGLKNEKIIPFELQEFPIKTCYEAIDHFNSIIDLDLYESTCDKHKSKVKIVYKDPNYQLSEEELIFITNEQIMCKWSAKYWEERYFKIQDGEDGAWINYAPNIPQRVNDRICARLQKARRAIRKLTVKARQEGETTWSQGKVLQRLNYFEDANALISSKDSDSTGKMSKKFTDALNKLPYWNRIFLTRYETDSFYEYDNKAALDLGYGTQASLGRGRTLNLAHLSEVPFYKKPQEAIKDGLFKAMHESIWTLQLLEGTAEVRGDFFHKLWLETVSGMEQGITSIVAVFHPWYMRTDIYPTIAWLQARSSYYENWTPSLETIQHANKAKRWVQTNPDARAEFGSNWQMSREQMFFYELEKAEAKRTNSLQNFLKEMPSDPEEAFQNAGQSVYSIELLISLSDQAQQINPEVYKLRGDSNEVDPLLFPIEDEIDYSGNRAIINIRSNWAYPEIPFSDYELVPVKFEGWDKFDPINKILIWEHPVNYAEYGLSVDPSDGLGRLVSDDAVICGIKKGTQEYKDRQVFEFASPELPQRMLAPFVDAIGTYFSPKEQILIAPEVNDGTELLNDLIRRGWSNIYRALDPTKLGQDINSAMKKYGFETNNRTRPELINALNDFLIGNWIIINSMPLIGELKDLQKVRNLQKTLGYQNQKVKGKNDNRFMAIGICLYALHRNEFIGLQTRAWEERIKNENSKVTFASFRESNYELDTELNSRFRGDDNDWYREEIPILDDDYFSADYPSN